MNITVDDEDDGGVVLEFTALDGSRQAAILVAGDQPTVKIALLPEIDLPLEQSATNQGD